jgi:hypothetical protein
MLPAFSDPTVNSRRFVKTNSPFFCKRIHWFVEGLKIPTPVRHRAHLPQGCCEGRATVGDGEDPCGGKRKR